MQGLALPGMHAPFWQVSLTVQGLLASQAVPSGTGAPFSHLPLAGLHVPPLTQGLALEQMRVVPVQVPLRQPSLTVQGLPSSQ